MKSKFIFLVLVLLLATAAGCQNANRTNQSIILATTTSLNDTGLLSYLLPKFSNETGIKVKPIAVGSGEALKMGERGDADAILAHSPDKEEELVRKGVAIKRNSFMYNFLLLSGPRIIRLKYQNPQVLRRLLKKLLRANKNLPHGQTSLALTRKS
jgi:tungstate transport system substrate-binding protein